MSCQIKAPFPWFGGKRRVAHDVWKRFGDVKNYVEPFAGSLAVLLGRPTDPKIETVNDLDCYLANFWRSLKNEPETVARWADWPVNEADLLARHKWLIGQRGFRECMKINPDFYDAKIAGWWVWGLCAWIGQGWCHTESAQLPYLGGAGMGINRKLPHLGDAGKGIEQYFIALADRLRGVRVACGDWKRVLGESVTIKHGITGVFLDPPYGGDRNQEYAIETDGVTNESALWAIENGDNPLIRIAYCGYEWTVVFPDNWCCVAWKAAGGYGSQGRGAGRENSKKERIWFSPHCLKAEMKGRQLELFNATQVAIS